MAHTPRGHHLAEIIERRHWIGSESLREIERDLGLANGALSRACLRDGVAVRSRSESRRLVENRIDRKSGESHWRALDRAGSAKLSATHGRRMKRMNRDSGFRRSVTDGHASHLRRNPTDGEIVVTQALSESGVPFVFQHVVMDRWILDWAWPEYGVALELDGRGWSSKYLRRGDSNTEKERILGEQGWYVVRFAQWRKTEPRLWRVFRVLQHLIPGFEIPGSLPTAPIGEYRMLVCCPQGARITLYPDELVRLRGLPHGGVDLPVPPAMGEYEVAESHFFDWLRTVRGLDE
jgi:very-short-patch-repair endonuclease